MTRTTASRAAWVTTASPRLAYESVSFSNTRCVIPQALKRLGNSICGASRSTKSLDFGFSLPMDAERSFWQSSLWLDTTDGSAHTYQVPRYSR